jgi:hypothetical protein
VYNCATLQCLSLRNNYSSYNDEKNLIKLLYKEYQSMGKKRIIKNAASRPR